MRGGYWGSIATHLLSSTLFSVVPTNQENIRGFRIATSVPEPSTAILIAMASLGLLWRRTIALRIGSNGPLFSQSSRHAPRAVTALVKTSRILRQLRHAERACYCRAGSCCFSAFAVRSQTA